MSYNNIPGIKHQNENDGRKNYVYGSQNLKGR